MRLDTLESQVLKYIGLLKFHIELNPNQDLRLFDGDMGKILYYFYYGYSLKNKDFIEKGGKLLEFTLSEIKKGNAEYLKNCSLSGGLAGLGMVIEILIGEGYIKDDLDTILAQFDIFIFTDAIRILKKGHTDFLHAGFGSILYLYYRIDRNPEVQEYLNELLTIVKLSLVFISSDKAYIPNKFLEEFNNDKNTISNGLAHGQIGYALILLKFIEKKVLVDLTESILNPLLTFIWGLYNEVPEDGESYFPFFYNLDYPESKEFYIKSLRWCYGDLSALHLLYLVNKFYPNEQLLSRIRILEKSVLSIRDEPQYLFRHSLLCHGTTGIAYYFKKLFEISQNGDFEIAYYFYLNLSFEIFDEEFENKDIIKISGGCLDGFVGSSLVLLNYINRDADYWDKLLLFS